MRFIDYLYWIHSAFNKKFYISYGSVIRAARLKKILFCLGHHYYLCTYDVAGLGTVEEGINQCNGSVDHLRVYESIESFRKDEYFCCKAKGCYDFHGIKISTESILKKVYNGIADVICRDGYYHVFRYRWNGINAEEVDLADNNVWLDENGFHTDARIPEGTYPTREECENANQISVIEFDD